MGAVHLALDGTAGYHLPQWCALGSIMDALDHKIEEAAGRQVAYMRAHRELFKAHKVPADRRVGPELILSVVAICLAVWTGWSSKIAAEATLAQVAIASEAVREAKRADAFDNYVAAVSRMCDEAFIGDAEIDTIGYDSLSRLGYVVYDPGLVQGITIQRKVETYAKLMKLFGAVELKRVAWSNWADWYDDQIIRRYTKYLRQTILRDNNPIKSLWLTSIQNEVVCRANLEELIIWNQDRNRVPVFITRSNVIFIPLSSKGNKIDVKNELAKIGAEDDIEHQAAAINIFKDRFIIDLAPADILVESGGYETMTITNNDRPRQGRR